MNHRDARNYAVQLLGYLGATNIEPVIELFPTHETIECGNPDQGIPTDQHELQSLLPAGVHVQRYSLRNRILIRIPFSEVDRWHQRGQCIQSPTLSRKLHCIHRLMAGFGCVSVCSLILIVLLMWEFDGKDSI